MGTYLKGVFRRLQICNSSIDEPLDKKIPVLKRRTGDTQARAMTSGKLRKRRAQSKEALQITRARLLRRRSTTTVCHTGLQQLRSTVFRLRRSSPPSTGQFWDANTRRHDMLETMCFQPLPGHCRYPTSRGFSKVLPPRPNASSGALNEATTAAIKTTLQSTVEEY